MNAGIVTSFLVGGLLLLSILQLNFTVSNSSNKNVLQTVAKKKMQSLTETLTYDIKRIGQGTKDPTKDATSAINSLSDNQKIRFQSEASGTLQNTTWEIEGKDNATDKMNDYRLVRTAYNQSGNQTKTTFTVVSFNIQYINSSGDLEDNPDGNTVGLKISVATESPEGIQKQNSDSTFYGHSNWEHTIYPPVLNFN